MPALLLACITFVSCVSAPWKSEKGDELNLSITFDRNVPIVHAEVNGLPARLIVGTATQRSSLLALSSPARQTSIALGGRRSVTLAAEQAPATITFADGILGADAFRATILTIDYQRALLILGTRRSDLSDGVQYRYRRIPAVPLIVSGKTYYAVVDSTLPDSVVLPALPGQKRRVTVGYELAGRHGTIDVFYDDAVRVPRIGSRLLERYLLTIDYGRSVVTLWGRQPE